MDRPHKISIAGFSDAEFEALSRYFLQTTPPAPRFELAPLPQQADIVLADGANTAHLRQLKAMRLQAQVLLVGPSKTYPDLPFERRPVALPDLLRAAQYLLGIYDAAASPPSPGVAPSAPTTTPSANAPTQPLPLQTVKSEPPRAAPPAVSAPQAAAPAHPAHKAAYAATEPMGLQVAPAHTGYDATQPMGFEALFQQAGYDAQPAWAEDGGIQPDEIAAFRAARQAADAGAPVAPVIMERVELSAEPTACDSTQNSTGLAAPPVAAAQGGDGPRALLVDAADVDARRIERLLTYMGYGVVRVRSAADALLRAGEGHYALVLVDTSLDGGGYSHCRALRQRLRPHSPDAALFALGRAAGALERWRARLAGCSACVTKPVDLAKLEAIIEAHEPAGTGQGKRKQGQ